MRRASLLTDEKIHPNDDVDMSQPITIVEKIIADLNDELLDIIEDYEEDLKSQIADIKQCTLEGGPDHIHATRFLGRFVENKVPWLHVDLSSSNRKGGLGAVSSEVNGFGVSFGVNMIEKLMKIKAL